MTDALPTTRVPPLDGDTAAALAHAGHSDPFAILGPHEGPEGRFVRVFVPGATGVLVVARASGEALSELVPAEPSGLFVGPLPSDEPYALRIAWPGGTEDVEDAYSFGTLLGDLDLYLIAEGRHWHLADALGARPMTVDGVPGTRFSVWAPNARRVSVIGDFNSWDGRRHPMRNRSNAGVWEIFIPRVSESAVYKYEITGRHGERLPEKADPVATETEMPPKTASVVPSPHVHEWQDGDWMAGRAARHAANAPISIYEVHVGSWLKPDGQDLDWDGLAERLVAYARDMGFTHIELLPVTEHPFAGSWGYQPLGMFAPTRRFGRPDGFARFVESCHAAGIGVIVDWVPAHFPTDAHGLANFDGTHLYEHSDPREGFHQDWNTLIYNLGRNEVSGFLIASALHWLEHYHIDGLRVDAVASMLYRDYSRNHGEWVPNQYGGRENLEAVEFLKRLNTVVADRYPGAMVIAEESTAWPGVSRPVSEGGLGFSYKWNMGWMHDTLHYIQNDPIHREWHYGEVTFGLVYAFSEKFVLPLSHDEVVHGKGSLIGRMPGDRWQRFANLRAYFGFMWGHPGKKLLFMGGEIAQEREWDHDGQIDWHLLDDPMHRGVQTLVRDLNGLYARTPALHGADTDPSGFQWIIGNDAQNSVYAFFRKADGAKPALVVCNMTPVPRENYRIGVPHPGFWREVLNTDAEGYGGSNLGNGGGLQTIEVEVHGERQALDLTLPPLATIVLAFEG